MKKKLIITFIVLLVIGASLAGVYFSQEKEWEITYSFLENQEQTFNKFTPQQSTILLTNDDVDFQGQNEVLFYGYKHSDYSDETIITEYDVSCLWGEPSHPNKTCYAEAYYEDKNLLSLTSINPATDISIEGLDYNHVLYYSTSCKDVNQTIQNVSDIIKIPRKECDSWQLLSGLKSNINAKQFGIQAVWQMPKYATGHFNWSIGGSKADPDISACGTLNSAGAIYNLTQDVFTTGTCFIIGADSVTLDMRGYNATGDNSGAQDICVQNVGWNNTVIKNGGCNNFSAGGIGISSAVAPNPPIFNNTITNMSFFNITGSNAAIKITIFPATSGGNHTISNNIIDVDVSGIEITADNNTIGNNYIVSRSASGSIIASGCNSTFFNNTINNSVGNSIVGGSGTFNRYVDNIIINSGADGIQFLAGQNNYVEGGRIDGWVGYAISATTGDNQLYRDMNLTDSDGSHTNTILLVNTAENITILNISYNIHNETVNSNSELIRKWYYKAFVNWTNGSAVNSGNVWGENNSNGLVFNATISNGVIPLQEITDYINNATLVNYHSPYNLTASVNPSANHTFNASLGNNYTDFFELQDASPVLSNFQFFALNSSDGLISGGIDAFNFTNLEDIEFMNISFELTDGTGFGGDIAIYFTANGTNGCSLGNNQSTTCYNHPNNTWIEFRNGTNTNTFRDIGGAGAGDFIDCNYVGNATFRNYSCEIDEHYNPNVWKHYPFNFSDVKWQSGANERIRKNTIWKIQLDTTNIPLDAEEYKIDFRVNATFGATPTQQLLTWLCNSTYTTGSPDASDYCQLVGSVLPGDLTDGGTKAREIFQNSTVMDLGDIQYVLLETDSPASAYYSMRTYQFLGDTDSRTSISTNNGGSYTNLTDGYETELNINWFYGGLGNEPTGIVFKIWSNDSLGNNANSSEYVMTWNEGDLDEPPVVDIIVPEINTNHSGTIAINWTTAEPNGDSYRTNVTANNGTATEEIAINLDDTISNTTWDTSAVSPGYWNVTVESCENETALLLCGNDTHQIYVDSIAPTITLISPVNDSVNATTEMNFTLEANDTVSGVANVTWRIYNSTDLVNITTRIFASNPLTIITGLVVTLVDDVYTWYVQARDAFNNLVTSENRTAEIRSNVSMEIVYPTEGQENVSKGYFFNVTFNVSCEGNCGLFDVSIDPPENYDIGFEMSEALKPKIRFVNKTGIESYLFYNLSKGEVLYNEDTNSSYALIEMYVNKTVYNFLLNAYQSPTLGKCNIIKDYLSDTYPSATCQQIEDILTEYITQGLPLYKKGINGGRVDVSGNKVTIYFYDVSVGDDLKIGTNSVEYLVYSSVSDIVFKNNTEVSIHGARLVYNGTYETGYNSTSGSFDSFVYYNSTQTYWNLTFNIANASGGMIDTSDSNLISYWTLDKNYNDYMGINNCSPTGTINVTGLSSGGMEFDSVDDNIKCGRDISLNLSLEDFAVSIWFKRDNNGPQQTLISKRETAADNKPGWTIRTNNVKSNDFFIKIGDGVDDFILFTTGEITDTNWHHIVFSIDRDSDAGCKIYVDGELAPSSPSGGDLISTIDNINSPSELVIGDRGDLGRRWNGSLDEAILYNRTLTLAEANGLYKAGLSQHGITNITLETRTASSYNISDSNLVSFWSLNGDANDLLGINNGTVTGASYSEDYGVVGGGYNFSGTNQYITLGDKSSLDFAGDSSFSISAWTKFESLSSTVASKYSFGGDKGWALFMWTGNRVRFTLNQNDATATVDLDANFGYVPGDWVHIVAVKNSTEPLKVYVNGYEGTYDDQLNGVNVNSPSGIPAYIGRRDDSTPTYDMDGSLDEIRIYNKALSDAEALSLYKLGGSHIQDWSLWQDEGLITNEETIESAGADSFMQYRANFFSNQTQNSPYLINHSIYSSAEAPAPPVGKGLISTVVGATPFYTNATDNPWQINLTGGGSQIVTFWVNATGNLSSNHTFFGYVNSTLNPSISDITDNWTVTIQAPPATIPEINITYPLPITYNHNISELNYTLKNDTQACWYSLDSGITNTTITCGDNVTGLTSGEGNHMWTLWANNSDGIERNDSVNFTVDYTGIDITIDLPTGTYNYTTDIPLNFSVDETPNACWYSLNGASNITLAGCLNTTFNGSVEGSNTILVYANDSVNNIGYDTSTYEINTQPNLMIISPQEQNYNLTEDINITSVCKYLNSTLCNNDINQRITAWYPNGSIFFSSKLMTFRVPGRWDYITTNPGISGNYPGVVVAYDGSPNNQTGVFTFTINETMGGTPTPISPTLNPRYCPKGGKYCDCSIYGDC